MKITLRTTAVAVVALLVGLMAGPALALTSEEAEDCIWAILASDNNFLPEDDFPEPAPGEGQSQYFETNSDAEANFFALLDELGVDSEDICEIGGTYVPDGGPSNGGTSGTDGTNGGTGTTDVGETEVEGIEESIEGRDDSEVEGIEESAPDTEREEVTPVRSPVDPPAAQPTTARLPVTGSDAAIIGAFGIVLLGLGVVAVRGTRRRAHEA